MDSGRKINAGKLGYYLDGWADLIEGMGAKADDVRADVVKQLQERNMPDIQVEKAIIREGSILSARREYAITTTSPGATTTIYVAKHGNDLFASWHTYIQSTINWALMLVYLGAAFFSVVVSMVLRSVLGTFALASLIMESPGWDAFWYEVKQYTMPFSEMMGLTIASFISILVLSMLTGLIVRRNLFAYILKEPSLFDKEDITAMSLSVHKSILRALDIAGIDVSKLRLKREFKGGRRGEGV